MIEQQHPELSLSRQCEWVDIARSSYYDRPGGEGEINLDLMRLIDEQYLKTPWYGSRQWIGPHGECCRGDCQIRWMQTFVLRRCRRRLVNTAAP
jgi:hypothetical protein